MQDLKKNVVYSPHWQELRMALKGKWVGATAANIVLCREYIVLSQFEITHIWRVLNILNAVRRGFHGMGIVGGDADKTLVEFQKEVSALYKQKKAEGKRLVEVTEQQVINEWSLLEDDIKADILKDVKQRLSLHSQSKHRDDLRWFIDIVETL